MTTITINNLYIFMLLYVSIMAIIIKVLIQRDKKLKLQKYEIDIRYGSDPKIAAQLDMFINEIFDEYRLYNLEYKDDDYIKEADVTKIIKEVSELVTQRISPVIQTLLSTYYNYESIGEVIATKVYAKVTEYKIVRGIDTNKK